MTRDNIYQAITQMLDLCVGKTQTMENNIPLLVKSLDAVALAYHFAEDSFDPTNSPKPPDNDYQQLRTIISARFPSLGFYNRPSEIATQITQASIVVGDAIDDLTDIILDLQAIKWRWENTNIDDALWHYRLTFEIHWGQHLRDLQWYLHDLMSESGRLLLNQVTA